MSPHRTDILTQSGHFFDFLHPETSVILIEDIAHGLSNECRFGGQPAAFYSVAQHSLLVSMVVPAHLAFEGLMHDAHEAYMKDMMKPLKRLLPDYQRLEHLVETEVLARFGITLPLHPDIKRADMIVQATEKRDLMPAHYGAADDTAGVEPLLSRIIPMAPGLAKAHFLRRFNELMALRAVAVA